MSLLEREPDVSAELHIPLASVAGASSRRRRRLPAGPETPGRRSSLSAGRSVHKHEQTEESLLSGEEEEGGI